MPTGTIELSSVFMCSRTTSRIFFDGNDSEDRELTSRLYGGDTRTRIRQEMVLGVGGVKAIRALGIVPGVYHLNEGHSAFATLEAVRGRVDVAHTLGIDRALPQGVADVAARVAHVQALVEALRAAADNNNVLAGDLGDAVGKFAAGHEAASRELVQLRGLAQGVVVVNAFRHRYDIGKRRVDVWSWEMIEGKQKRDLGTL